jgi:hypothetical protein
MSKRVSKRQKDRQRLKESELKRREARENQRNPVEASASEPKPADIRTWPIVRAYVPVEDVFRATGFGSAGLVRQDPNGKLRYSFVMISLLDGGIQGIFGKENSAEEELEKLLKEVGGEIPPYEIGQAGLAARYIWGAHALGLNSGYGADAQWMHLLSVVPAIAGKPRDWFKQLVGPQGLADFRLMKFLEKNPVPDDIPEDKEVFVWITATFACSNPDAIRERLKTMEPEFSYDGEVEDGADQFTWSRAYPKDHWSPLSKLGGRQTLGSVQIFAHTVVAESKTLSMASILIGKLKAAFGDDIRLTDTQWKSAADLIRERDSAKNATG